MPDIRHKFIDHKINEQTEILIIGTFNPDIDSNDANFFYSRARNHLWTLLPTAFDEPSLKGKSQDEKKEFIIRHKISFIDLIAVAGETPDYSDAKLDPKVITWQNVIGEIDKLQFLKKVAFTRKTLSDIPRMRVKIEEVKVHCEQRKVHFQYLTTPARFYSKKKQQQWSDFLTTL